LHQVGDLFELNVKLQCQKVKRVHPFVCGIFKNQLFTIHQTWLPFFFTNNHMFWSFPTIIGPSVQYFQV